MRGLAGCADVGGKAEKSASHLRTFGVIKLLNREFGLRSFFAAACFALFGFFAAFPAQADYVGEVQTTKYLDPTTINMIANRLQAGQAGIQVGDEISYFIQFTPTDNGGIIGAGGYVTDYIPAGTQVVNAQFVQLNGDGSFSQIAPPPPAEVMAAYVPGVSDTGIFFSTDPRTTQYTNPVSLAITSINGYPAMGGMTTHNLWDSQMVVAYSNVARVATVGCPLVSPWVATMGAGPVAGRDTVLQNDYTGGTGPWQRISYPGSYFGTMTGTLGTYGGCVGGAPTTAGWALSSSNPLPVGTNAVRFAAGRVTVGELFSVRITLKITQPIPLTGLINNTEVFGGDTSIKAPGTLVGKDVVWKYHIPNVANANTTLTVIKRVVGMCTGVGCVPQAFSGGAVPALANLKLRYEVTYLNSSGGPQTAVTLSDILPLGATLVAGSEVVKTGPDILPATLTAAATAIAGPTYSFKTLASLGSGSGGTVQLDVNVAAPAVKQAISNTAKLVSLSLPGGVQSVATVSPTNTASLMLNVTTSTPTSAPGGTATYTVSLSNSGAAVATLGPLATDGAFVQTLPSSGGILATERFTFKQPIAGTLCGAVTLAANQACGVLSTPTAPTVLVPNPAPTLSYVVMNVTGAGAAAIAPSPYAGQNREQLTFRPAALTSIPISGKLEITFSSTVGTSVASSAVGYTSDAVVTYGGGFVTAPGLTTITTSGVASVKVDIPLSVTVAIACVYDALGACNAYSGGSIPSASKVKYRLNYANSGAAQTNVILTNTLPANTSFVAGSASTAAPVLAGQVMTFPTLPTLAAGASGSVTFDMQLPCATPATVGCIPSGSYITNTAQIKSDLFAGGATSSLTTTVNDSANLSVTLTTSTPELVKCTAVNTPAGCGQASYSITVTNTGYSTATGVVVNGLLPFTGAAADPLIRFNFTTGSSSLLPQPTPVVPPTVPGYTTNLNQQQVAWSVGTLAAGASTTITFKADAGASLAAGSTVYMSSVVVNYTSGATALTAAALNTAPVAIPSNLAVTTTIDCIYDALGACNAYTGSGIVPVNAKVRYKMHYQNKAAVAKTNVYLCSQITSSIAPALTTTITTPTIAPTPTGPFTNAPALALPAAPIPAAVAACGFTAPVAPVTQQSFNYPVIPSLAAGASGDVYFDVQTNAAAGATLTNTGKMTVSTASATAPTESESSAVPAYVQDIPVLQITKSVAAPASKSAGDTATYTITIKNTGNTATTALKVFDFLPYSGTTADATKRFAYVSTTGYTGGLAAPAIIAPETVSIPTNVPPTQSPFSSNTNQQQVKWDFGAYALAAGASVSITFTAQVGSAMPAGVYDNHVRVEYTSLGGAGSTTSSFTDYSDRVSVDASDLSTSTMTWVDLNGGEHKPGDTIRYTVTMPNTSTLFGATNVSVVNDIPANIAAFTHTTAPSSGTDVSTGYGTGANGTGQYKVTGISVAANGTVTLTYDVVISASAPLGSTINNCATVTNPSGLGATPCASALTVSNSTVPGTGMKNLYFYDATSSPAFKLSRAVPAAGAQTVTLAAATIVTGVAPSWIANVTGDVLVEAWGGGGGGGAGTGRPAKGGGGAGGQYARKTVAVTTGTPYAITIGAGGVAGVTALPNGGLGGDSTFGAGLVVAKGGAGGVGATVNNTCGAAGVGAATGGVGEVGGVFAGGSGSACATTAAPAGGAGGGGAGSSGVGGNAVGDTAGIGTAAGGGAGGAGLAARAVGNPGVVSGGAGGGGYATNNTNQSGGAGAAGKVVITISGGSQIFTQDPPLASSVTIDSAVSANVPVQLYLARGGVGTYGARVDLYCSSAPATMISSSTATPALALTATPTLYTFNLPLTGTMSCPAGSSWVVKVSNLSTVGLIVSANGTNTSNASLPSQNVINVDSVTTTLSTDVGGVQHAVVRAVVNDPFGNFDITSAAVTIKDPSSVAKVTGAAMVVDDAALTGSVSVTQNSTAVTGTGTLFTTELSVGSVINIGGVCNTVASITSDTALTLTRTYTAATAAGGAATKPVNCATKTLKYDYSPVPATAGDWTATVTAKEGTENTVSDVGIGTFTISALDHIRIDHTGTGVTCTPSAIKFTGCKDASCTTKAEGTVITLLPAGGWEDASGATITTVTTAAVTGEATAYLAKTTPQTVTLSASSAGVGASCYIGGTANCAHVFTDAGFIFTTAKDATETAILNQTAGNLTGVVLRAVKTDKVTKACVSALTGAQTVNFAYECNDPTSCGAGNNLKVNGTPVAGNNDCGGLVSCLGGLSYTGVSLNFDTNGNAVADAAVVPTVPVVFAFEDVGDVTLHVGAKTLTKGQLTKTSSGKFRVSPHHFAVDVCAAATAGDCPVNTAATATDGTGSVLAKAGATFKTTVRAMSGNDNVTPSYATAGSANGGTSHSTETATLTHALIAPAAGDAGALEGTKSFVRDTFTSGVKTLSDLTWSEVGVLTIKADATKFMGVAHATTGTSNNAGRFIPDHFDTVATGPMACAPNAGCVSPVTTMAYSGQPFSVTVRAKKGGGTHVSGDANEITTNYKGSFAHDVTLGTAATGGSLNVVTITGASFSSGTASDATPKFTFTSATPPSAPTDVLISASDADVATSSAHEGGLKVVSGRIKIGNAYGSELIPLTVPVNVQYYDGTLWRNSTTDSTTQIDTTLGNNIVRSGALTGLSTVSGGVKTVQSGVLRNFQMAAPGAKGKATLSAASVGGDLDFLLPNSVSGEVTFGIYAAKQPFIYLRESY